MCLGIMNGLCEAYAAMEPESLIPLPYTQPAHICTHSYPHSLFYPAPTLLLSTEQEPHEPQPVLQGAPKRHQEAQELHPQVPQGGKSMLVCLWRCHVPPSLLPLLFARPVVDCQNLPIHLLLMYRWTPSTCATNGLPRSTTRRW